MRTACLLFIVLSCAATITAADLSRNGFRIERLTDKDEALIKPACVKIEFFKLDAASRVPSCYPGSWAAWIKTQKMAGIPASPRAAIDDCNMEGPAQKYIVSPDGAKYLIWHVWQKGGDDRTFWLVDAASRDINVILIRQDAPQYFGKRANALRQGKVGEWLNELQKETLF
jgi:hypothetical protein